MLKTNNGLLQSSECREFRRLVDCDDRFAVQLAGSELLFVASVVDVGLLSNTIKAENTISNFKNACDFFEKEGLRK